MAKVKLLEKTVAERIAAGEVVERPSSVVKELVENSLDAGATRITVEIKAGGIKAIRISDNGCGMTSEDMAMAIQRFATSKISQWDDLSSLNTLGFRGEALPSVAAVSRLSIKSCPASQEGGAELFVEGAGIPLIKPCSCPPGTIIEVTDLFYNTPARLKFLRSPVAETTCIIDLLGRMAIARPDVHFRLISNAKEVFSLPVGMTTAQRLARLWKIPDDTLVPIAGAKDGMEVDGYVALPCFTRNNRNLQLLLLNGRLIKSNNLSQALQEGFSPLLPRGRFPVAAIRLYMPADSFDVNVHPNKLEVRFLENRPIFSLIYNAVSRALEEFNADTVDERHLDYSLELPMRHRAQGDYPDTDEQLRAPALSQEEAPKQPIWMRHKPGEAGHGSPLASISKKTDGAPDYVAPVSPMFDAPAPDAEMAAAAPIAGVESAAPIAGVESAASQPVTPAVAQVVAPTLVETPPAEAPKPQKIIIPNFNASEREEDVLMSIMGRIDAVKEHHHAISRSGIALEREAWLRRRVGNPSLDGASTVSIAKPPAPGAKNGNDAAPTGAAPALAVAKFDGASTLSIEDAVKPQPLSCPTAVMPEAQLEVVRQEELLSVEEMPAPKRASRFQLYGQIHNTFIVGLVDGELWVVDQHTAHERVNYERLGHLSPLQSRSQGLLVPEVMEFSPQASEYLTHCGEELAQFGFEIEPFGKDTFQLRAVPSGLPQRRVLATFRDLIEELVSGAVSFKNSVGEQAREKIRAMTSCKAAVKAGDALSREDMQKLIDDMLEVEHSRYCPHGRPTRVKLDKRTLERLFHR